MPSTANRKGEPTFDPSPDESGMLDHLAHFADDLDKGFALGRDADVPTPTGTVWICGIGGSAIGALLTGAWANERARLPVNIHRGYGLPEGVEPGDTVVCVSHSGNTEETLSAYVQALDTETRRIAISSGGLLTEWAEEAGDTVVQVPPDRQPREGLGYSWFCQVGLMVSWGQGDEEEVKEAVAAVRDVQGELDPSVGLEDNLGKDIAARALEHVPVVYGYGPMAAPARRWATQFNENAKRAAFYGSLPEAQHNAIVAWALDPDSAGLLPVVLHSDGSEVDRVRLEFLEQTMQSHSDPVLINPPGDALLAKLATAVHIGDYATLYLALLRGIDPTPVEPIEALKEELAEVGVVDELRDRFEELVG